MTIKELLTENRDSVISSIQFVFKVYRNEDVKIKMVEFLAYAKENLDVEYLVNAKNTKTLLKNAIMKMSINQKREIKDIENIQKYGTTNPKTSEIRGYWMESKGYTSFNHLTSEYTK